MSKNPQKLKHKTVSIIVTISFIVVVVLLNVIVGIISDSVNITADLSANGVYTLDSQTENYMKSVLNSDVTVTVLSSEKTFESDKNNRQVSEILKEMARLNDHIKLNYLDLNQNPNYTSRFKGETLAANYIVVESEKNNRHRIITPQDYFGINDDQAAAYYYYYGIVGGYYIEQETLSAMIYATDEKLVKVAFTEGYSECDSSALRNLLTKNGYEVETVNLTTSEIPADVDIAVVFAPTIDIDSAQLEKLDTFLENDGKTVFYFASTLQPETPNIEEFLSDWGLSVGYSVIGQHDAQYLMSSITLYAHLQQVFDTDYTHSSYGKNLYMPGADLRPIIMTDRSGITLTPLVKTYDKAFLYPLNLGENERFDTDKAEDGVFNDIVISDNGKGKVCAVGSESFTGSILTSYSNSVNADLFIELFGSVSGKAETITINPKQSTAITFEMSASTAQVLAIVLCIAIPIVVIAFGIGVWIYRRHK